jgi:phosphatidylglycerophosphate synthase
MKDHGRIPAWIEGYHLTLMTIAWTAGLIGFGWLARHSLHWLWLSSLMLFLQWFTDSFDGALGRLRNTGIPLWGFYMDHFLDFLFMSAIFIGYAFLLGPPAQFLAFLIMLVYGAMMVSSFLMFGATGQFKITYLGLGPTEIRLAFIVLNTLVIFFGARLLAAVVPWALAAFCASLCVIVFQTQKGIWAMDMENKRNPQP